MIRRATLVSAAVLSALLAFAAQPRKAPANGVFARDNLVAWCIVPFDAAKRGPAERAGMLKRLGITMLAYDWRAEHVPTFDQELDELTRRGIRLQGFWVSTSLTPERDKPLGVILDFLKRRQVRTELWDWVMTPKEFDALPEAEKVERVARAVSWVAGEARKIGCSVGMYNHGGWTGEPENQLAVIRKVKMDNVGIVYNFHHGREQMDRFADFFPKIVPYLMSVNLNGMKKDAPMILPIGGGDRELEMMKVIRRSGYKGPVGILNHRTEVDAEAGLKQNLDGMRKTLAAMGDKQALKTY